MPIKMPKGASITRVPKVTERDVQIGVTSFLELDGWRAIRTDPVSDRRRGKGFGEVGMPDHLYLRYGLSPLAPVQMSQELPGATAARAQAEVMWIEFKAPGKKPKAHQLNWHKGERSYGALVKVVDGFEAFRTWYVNYSGLNRRMLLR